MLSADRRVHRCSPSPVLFFILGYLVYYGGRSLDWNFFTKLPLPPGEIGGGMANAIVGSVEIVGVAALIGLPVGFLAGVYLSEFEDKTFASAGALRGRPAERHALHRRRHPGLDAGGGPDAGRSPAWLGRSPSAVMLIPIVTRADRAVPARSAAFAARGRAGAGSEQMEDHRHRGGARRQQGNSDRHDPGRRAHRRRDRAAAVHRFNNQFWGGGITQPTASLPVMIYTHAIAPYDDWHRQAWAAGLVLIGMVLVANIAARLVLARGISVPRG